MKIAKHEEHKIIPKKEGDSFGYLILHKRTRGSKKAAKCKTAAAKLGG